MAECSHFVQDIEGLEKLVSEKNCPIHLKHEGRELIETVKGPNDFKKKKDVQKENRNVHGSQCLHKSCKGESKILTTSHASFEGWELFLNASL